MSENNQAEALLRLYYFLNGPIKAGPKYVQYNRIHIDAALDIVMQLMVAHGFEFSKSAPEAKGGEK